MKPGLLQGTAEKRSAVDGEKLGNAYIRRFLVFKAQGEGIPHGAMPGKKYPEALLRRFSQCLVGAIFRLDENGSTRRAPGKHNFFWGGIGQRFNVQLKVTY